VDGCCFHVFGRGLDGIGSIDARVGVVVTWLATSGERTEENKCRAYLDKDGVMICDECMISAMPGSPIPICEKTGRKIDVSATDAGLSENSRQNGGRSGDGDRTNGQDEMDPEFQARVLTGETCHSARDGDCDHPDCPQNSDGEPEKSGRHCPLDWNCARCGQNWGECECGPHDIPTPPSF